MKYAILSPRKNVMQVLDTANGQTVEITDEQATEVAALKAAHRIPILFEGAITTHFAEKQAGNFFRWDEEHGDFIRTPTPIPVPQTISAWQASAALKLTPFGSGNLHDAATAALAGMPEGAKKIVAQTAFEKDAQFVRTSPTIIAIAAALGLDSTAVDKLFILGDSLTV